MRVCVCVSEGVCERESVCARMRLHSHPLSAEEAGASHSVQAGPDSAVGDSSIGSEWDNAILEVSRADEKTPDQVGNVR